MIFVYLRQPELRHLLRTYSMLGRHKLITFFLSPLMFKTTKYGVATILVILQMKQLKQGD